MCILCVVQKWSRRVATMLPWLVIPLIGLWALSQLLPPGFRFEITSPRLACVLVLLLTLFWYEVLMPQLSAWRARRSARLRERKRFEAIELQKFRKTATRRCRNCLTPYRDQNPGGGRFMCSYCGHISKRPVLDLPGHNSIGNSGFIGDLVGKGGRILNSKVWSDNGWMCNGQEWSEDGSYLGRNRPAFFGGDDSCLPEKSYSIVVFFACKMLATFVFSIRWLWRKIFRVGSGGEDASMDDDHKRLLGKKGENGGDCQESKGEKARRKAEEKRQARLERELMEEEERKQREEVARLVEEQRRLRDEKLEAEKERCKVLSGNDGERDHRRETEKRKQDKRRDRDKGSSKSNSDGEELERKAGKEGERKRDLNKRNDIERRDHQKTTAEGAKPHASEARHDGKGVTNSFGRVYGGGSRYFDRVKGSFLTSSKVNFFGRNSHTAASASTKVTKFSGYGDHFQTPLPRKEVHHAEAVVGKHLSTWEGKSSGSLFTPAGGVYLQPQPNVQKKTWQQLFTRSSSSTSAPSQASQNERIEVKTPTSAGQTSPNIHLDNQIHYGLPSSFAVSPFSNGSMSVSPPFPPVGGQQHDFIPEEPELYEDPCYVPDPVSLLGPLSDSLDDFPLDLGSAFVPNVGLEKPHFLKNVSVAAEVNKPSPIESPMSRLRVAEDRHINSVVHPTTPKSQDIHSSSPDESGNTYPQGTWQMWGTTPLGQDGLGIMGGSANWLLSIGNNKPDMKDVVHPVASHKPVLPHFSNQVLSSSPPPPKVCIGNGNNNGALHPLGLVPNVNDPWLQEGAFQHYSGDKDSIFPPLSLTEGVSGFEVPFDNSNISASGHPFEVSPVNCWSKRDWAVNGAAGGVGNSAEARPHVGGLFSGPDVQSLWSFN